MSSRVEPGPPEAPAEHVPVRTIAATIGMVLGTVVAGVVVVRLGRIITWLVVAGFFALILNPVVVFFHRKLHLRRSLAVLLTFILGMGVMAGALYIFIRPIIDQTSHFADNFPRYVEDAKAGRGPAGGIIKRFKLDDYIERNQGRFREALSNAGKPAADIARKVASTLAAVLTIIVLMFLMLAEGPRMKHTTLNVLPGRYRDRVQKVASDSTRAITGYVAGNLLISLIASIVTFVSLLALDVPFRAVLSLWVFFADLIPLVGATLGAIPAVAVAFIASPAKGLVMLGVFVIYQQFENQILQVTIMARTVSLNPLAVLVSVLVGVELFGFLGALLAIPVAGVLHVIVRDLYDNRRGRLKPEPTIGADEVPMSEVIAEERAKEAASLAADEDPGDSDGGSSDGDGGSGDGGDSDGVLVPSAAGASHLAGAPDHRTVSSGTDPPAFGGPFSLDEAGDPLPSTVAQPAPASAARPVEAAGPEANGPAGPTTAVSGQESSEHNGDASVSRLWSKVRGRAGGPRGGH